MLTMQSVKPTLHFVCNAGLSNRMDPAALSLMAKFEVLGGDMKAAFPTALVAALGIPAVAWAQNPPPPAEVQGEPISLLMFFTLGIALALALGGIVWFLRKKSNRQAAERALDPNHPANR